MKSSSSEDQKLLRNQKGPGSTNDIPNYQKGPTPAVSSAAKADNSARNERIALLSKYQGQGPSMTYRGPAYMSTSAFHIMVEEIERQKEHSKLSRSASVGGDMLPSALNPVLTGPLHDMHNIPLIHVYVKHWHLRRHFL
jgi:hypothetical protein